MPSWCTCAIQRQWSTLFRSLLFHVTGSGQTTTFLDGQCSVEVYGVKAAVSVIQQGAPFPPLLSCLTSMALSVYGVKAASVIQQGAPFPPCFRI